MGHNMQCKCLAGDKGSHRLSCGWVDVHNFPFQRQFEQRNTPAKQGYGSTYGQRCSMGGNTLHEGLDRSSYCCNVTGIPKHVGNNPLPPRPPPETGPHIWGYCMQRQTSNYLQTAVACYPERMAITTTITRNGIQIAFQIAEETGSMLSGICHSTLGSSVQKPGTPTPTEPMLPTLTVNYVPRHHFHLPWKVHRDPDYYCWLLC